MLAGAHKQSCFRGVARGKYAMDRFRDQTKDSPLGTRTKKDRPFCLSVFGWNC